VLISSFPLFGSAGEKHPCNEALEETNGESPVQRETERKYVLGRMVGQGSIATVYSVVPEPGSVDAAQIARIVKVEILAKRRPIHGMQTIRSLFKRELEGAQLLNTVKHENVIATISIFLLPGNLGFGSIHPRCFGGDLFVVVEKLTQMRRTQERESEEISRESDRIVRPYLAVILDVLDYLHNRGIIHRDVKPENLLFERWVEGEPFPQATDLRFVDFGFARKGVEIPVFGLDPHPGTPPYMLPALFLSHACDGRDADLHAAACVFYVVLTGAFPFRYPCRMAGGKTKKEVHKRNYEAGRFEAELSESEGGGRSAAQYLSFISPDSLAFLRAVLHTPESPAEKRLTISELRAQFPWCTKQQ